MDGQRFDDLTRALAGGTSRRRLLKGLLGGVGGGALTLAGVARGDAARLRPLGARCRLGDQCDTGICDPVTRRCACPADQSVCGQGCVTLAAFQTDPANCGGCGVLCPSGVCEGGACLRVDGESCAAGTECRSGACADGVCCDRACGGQCEACNLAGAVGVCTPVVGAPIGGRAACAGDGSACGGTCDGTRGDACAYPGGTTICRSATCANGVATAAGTCDGAGSCSAATTINCAPFVCGADACSTSCAGDGDCVPGAYCEGGVCNPDEGLGAPCADGAECASGFCVDGVCCNGACAGGCEACNVAGQEGMCVGCAGATTCCGETCIDLASDPNNCGGCGAVCPAGANAAEVVCAASTCAITTCAAGFADCDGDAANGCETVLGTDANCGACGDACTTAGATCGGGGTPGVCGAPPPADTCGGVCKPMGDLSFNGCADGCVCSSLFEGVCVKYEPPPPVACGGECHPRDGFWCPNSGPNCYCNAFTYQCYSG